MYTKILLFATFCVFCKGQSSDPYDEVGPCSSKVLRFKVIDFDITEIANSGPFNYVYSSVLDDAKCASGVIYGDKNLTFRGSATVTTVDGVTTTRTFSLGKVLKGVIDESFNVTDSTGTVTTYEFKLIVKKWSLSSGVFEYIRCSKYGKGDIDSRSILINTCQASNQTSKDLAAKWASNDKSFHYRGKLQPVSQCD